MNKRKKKEYGHAHTYKYVYRHYSLCHKRLWKHKLLYFLVSTVVSQQKSINISKRGFIPNNTFILRIRYTTPPKWAELMRYATRTEL